MKQQSKQKSALPEKLKQAHSICSVGLQDCGCYCKPDLSSHRAFCTQQYRPRERRYTPCLKRIGFPHIPHTLPCKDSFYAHVLRIPPILGLHKRKRKQGSPLLTQFLIHHILKYCKNFITGALSSNFSPTNTRFLHNKQNNLKNVNQYDVSHLYLLPSCLPTAQANTEPLECFLVSVQSGHTCLLLITSSILSLSAPFPCSSTHFNPLDLPPHPHLPLLSSFSSSQCQASSPRGLSCSPVIKEVPLLVSKRTKKLS